MAGNANALPQWHVGRPDRWSGKTRNWTPIGIVSLNPERELQITVAEPEKQVA
ncbi:hypothetical protein GCM10023342_20830 [Modicisalibacter zincidurans]|uniref:Uncharacterized protein n=1 Tax=Modicisalibacter zincidurans TaxID=1178777 RepID=A0ABP9RG32_9GAMM